MSPTSWDYRDDGRILWNLERVSDYPFADIKGLNMASLNLSIDNPVSKPDDPFLCLPSYGLIGWI
jgi:hypothetical protein